MPCSTFNLTYEVLLLDHAMMMGVAAGAAEISACHRATH
jgi:hypothetical protein